MTDTLREPSRARHPPAERAAPKARPWWRVAPVDRHGLVVWVVAYVVLAALAIGAGYLLMHELGAVRSFDDRVARWLPQTLRGHLTVIVVTHRPSLLALCDRVMIVEGGHAAWSANSSTGSHRVAS